MNWGEKMAMDFEKVKEYLRVAENIENSLFDHQELFDYEKLIEFKQISTSLRQNLETAQSESRKLSIGIIGAVKAGKSSFLNACIFGGEEYLPKAATPMTASLTKITYSEKPRAIIHFYTEEDWKDIEKQSEMYDKGLEKEYNDYKARIQIKKEQPNYIGTSLVPLKFKSKEEFEKTYKCKSENQSEAKELTRMIKNPELLEKLGGMDEIEGDVISKLNDYVGANGYYTPIVSYVELQIDNPNMKDFEIVDTPGLNDPIISRGIQTKRFLRNCDVALLLSPCGQFMDSSTVHLMASSLPDTGVNEILIIGSKFDSGILNEDEDSFGRAYKKSVYSYKTQFSNNLTEAKKSGKHLEILNKLSAEKVLYVSAVSFVIEQKLKEGKKLDKNEQVIYDNLHRFSDFKNEFFTSLSGMSKVKKSLSEVIKRKAEIIEGKNDNLLNNAKNNHLRILEKILQETVSSRTKLETTTAEELKQRTLMIRDTIDFSRSKLMHIFDGAIFKCEEKIQQIFPQLSLEMSQHEKVLVKTSTEDKYEIVSVGFRGWKKEVIYYTVTNNTVDTAEVIQNIRQYSAKCHIYVNSEFNYIFNKEEFSQKIKDVILTAFSKGGKEFDEDDILLPLQNILSKISIPHINLDFTKYIDEVETRFKGGYAENEKIHELTELQSKLLNQMEEEISDQLLKSLQEITETLRIQAVTFADRIEKDFCAELDKLKKQIKEREHYIKEYCDFAENVRKMKNQILV